MTLILFQTKWQEQTRCLWKKKSQAEMRRTFLFSQLFPKRRRQRRRLSGDTKWGETKYNQNQCCDQNLCCAMYTFAFLPGSKHCNFNNYHCCVMGTISFCPVHSNFNKKPVLRHVTLSKHKFVNILVASVKKL